jgi:hypothetical protein
MLRCERALGWVKQRSNGLIKDLKVRGPKPYVQVDAGTALTHCSGSVVIMRGGETGCFFQVLKQMQSEMSASPYAREISGANCEM